MKELLTRIYAAAEKYPCRLALSITNLGSGQTVEEQSELIFASASTIKVPIMLEIMRQASQGMLSLSETLPVPETAKVDGSILTELRTGLEMTLLDLVTLMIILSDNTATNMLIDRIGMAPVNNTLMKLNLKATRLRRKMMDFSAAAAGHENTTCAKDLAALFSGIYHGTLGLPEKYNTLMLSILKRQQIRDKFPFYLPEEAIIANKTGTLDKLEHDAGIIYAPRGTFCAVALADKLRCNYEGLLLEAAIGKLIYDYAS